jgi:polar amino acid transport system substrate-binding protein
VKLPVSLDAEEEAMKKLILIVCGLLFSTTLFAQSVDDLVFITEDYAPLNFSKDGKVQGISVDVMVEMLKVAGSKKTREDIMLQPWARGYKQALNKKNTTLFAMSRTEAREELFKWVGPIIPSNIVLVAKKSRGIKINSVEDISQYNTIGVVRDDIGEQMLLELGISKKQLHQTNSGTSTAKMLDKGRVDMWAYGRIVALWNIKELGFNPGDYEEVYTLKESQQYFAFHKDTESTIIAKLQNALDELRSNGKLNEIVSTYLK